MYDSSRSKILSLTRVYLRAGTHRRTVSNEYLRLEDGQPSMGVGDGVARTATITGITVNTESPWSWTLKIMRKGSSTPLVTFPVASNYLASNMTLNVDVPLDSVILFKVDGSNIPFPRVLLELAWRL